MIIIKSINNNFLINIFCLNISFILCIMLGYIFIYISKKIKIIQKSKNINKILDKKIPTLGGIFINLSIILSILMLIKIDYCIFVILFTIISYSILGFVDDYIKIFNKHSNGLSIKNKYICQSILSIIISLFIYTNNIFINLNVISIPFYGNIIIEKNILIFVLISYFVIISTSNSMNIVDGLDGLSIKITIHIVLSLIILSYINLYNNCINILNIYKIVNVCFIILGSSLAFLWFNSFPAKIFMGDVGSLSIGSLIGLISILLNKEFFILILGFILIIETMSVIIQILIYKLFKIRFFNIAPLHHNYQIKKYHENKIVERFSIISIIFNIIGVLSLLIN